MLKSTHPSAGTNGRSSANPLLSSAAKAINCCDAMAESGIVIAVNIAPAVVEFPTFCYTWSVKPSNPLVPSAIP
jgi:hypothetical protein